MMNTRRAFIKKTAISAVGLTLGGYGMSAKSYGKIMGSNDRIRVGIVGFSERFKSSLLPSFLAHSQTMNFELAALSDIWRRRREEGGAVVRKHIGGDVALFRNNEELYDRGDIDAVIISTADFQHAYHLTEAAIAGKDAYCEKPFAETMDDANMALEAVKRAGIIVQIGSQRRSGANYHAANDYIRSGKFGDIVMVEMCWNVNQPGRWRLPELVSSIKESDTDWRRFLINRPVEPWDPRKYLEYRLFWPYSSGIPGQWMSHQIDTVHWFTGLSHPRSVAANGGIYQWRDGRTNPDTLTAVFDYGPMDGSGKGFQVVYSSRFSNSAGDTKELYYSNSGMLDLDKNQVTPAGGLTAAHASAMGLAANQLEAYVLPQIKTASGANTGGDSLTAAHMQNWMDCVRSRKTPHAPVEAGYNHAVACIMANAAYRTGHRATFDHESKQVLAGNNVFTY